MTLPLEFAARAFLENTVISLLHLEYCSLHWGLRVDIMLGSSCCSFFSRLSAANFENSRASASAHGMILQSKLTWCLATVSLFVAL